MQSSLGEADNRERAGSLPVFLYFSHLLDTIQIKSFLIGTVPLHTPISPSGESPGISDASSQPHLHMKLHLYVNPEMPK